MTQFVFANNINTQLAAAVTATDTVLTLGSSLGLPTLATGEMMPVTLVSLTSTEICYATAINGANLTVLRGQENTAAQPWAVGATVIAAPTAGTVAPVNGNPDNEFQVAPAQNPADAVQLAQVSQALPLGGTASSTSLTDLTATTATFTAPSKGYAMIFGYGQSSTANVVGGPVSGGLNASLAGMIPLAGIRNTAYTSYETAYLPMTAGQESTFSFNMQTSTAGALDAFVTVMFIPTP